MTLVRTGLSMLSQVRTGLSYLTGRRVSLTDTGSGPTTAVPLKWALTPLATNAVISVVTNTNITVYARNGDGTLGAAVTGSWTSGTGSATDAGLTPTETASDFVGIASAPTAGKHCWMYFNDTQDVEWCLPGHPLNPQTATRKPLDRPFGLFIQGGRNHRMVGATFGFSRNWAADFAGAQGQNTPAGSGYFGQWNRHLYIKDWTGVWDIIGMSMVPGFFYEAMNVTGFKTTGPRIRVQRSRADGCTWYNPGSGHDGGDGGIQTWHGPTGWTEFDHYTVVTDYQAIFLVWNDVGTNQVPDGQTISYTNVRTVHPSGAWVIFNTKSANPPPPTTYDHVYVTDVANPTRSMNGASGSLVYTAGLTPTVSADGATATWTGVAGANSTGSITRVADGTTLPGGTAADYAPANRVGFDYDETWPGWAPSGT